ncbi:uncharacterized protein LOC144357874 [Saccoglossus kowalevskii]
MGLSGSPLTYISSDNKDDIPLTPSHLLNGRALTSLPDNNVATEYVDPSYNVNKQYDRVSGMMMHFWKRWSNEYLTALRERHSSSEMKSNTIQVGDVVLIHHDVEKRQHWKLARVTKLNYGNDGIVLNQTVYFVYVL